MKDDFNTILDFYKPKIYAYVLTISKSVYAAEDLTQDIMIKLWLKRNELNQIRNLNGYVFIIAKNMTLNYLLKVSFNERMATEMIKSATVNHNHTDSKVTMFDYNKLIEEASKGLTPQRKLVFKLSREEELSYDEIASKLNLSRFTVKNHYLTALGVVRAFLIKNGVNAVSIFFILACDIIDEYAKILFNKF